MYTMYIVHIKCRFVHCDKTNLFSSKYLLTMINQGEKLSYLLWIGEVKV